MIKHQLIATDSVQIPKIYSIGFSDDPDIARYGPSVRRKYIIHYVLSGKGYFNGNMVKKEQGFLIVPGMHQEYYPDESDPWSFLWFISEDPAMQYFFDRHEANEETGIFTFRNLYEVNTVADLLRASSSSFSSSTIKIFTYAFPQSYLF